jgi:GT2 family glycosyltransferase
MGTRALLSIIVTTRNRANILRQTLEKHLKIFSNINSVEIIIVDGASADQTPNVVKTLKELFTTTEVKYYRSAKSEGSPAAFNIGTDLSHGDIIMWLADDMEIPNEGVIHAILEDFKNFPSVGIVGGRRIELKKLRIDPPFYIKFGDFLTKLTGFVFLDIYTGTRYAEFVPAPLACRRDIAIKYRYDENYKFTGYREETDLQHQVKKSGWKILFDPRIIVYHYGQETGGNRGQSFNERIYWKTRNHMYYLLKFFTGIKLWWYVLASFLILLIYSGMRFFLIKKAIKDSFELGKIENT